MNNQEKLARIREFCNSVPERDPGYEVACDNPGFHRRPRRFDGGMMAVHNHGPDDPANPFCGESMVGGKLTGECLKSESQASVRAVLTEALSEALKRLWTDPEDAADQADWDALPGKLADVIASLPGVAVMQLPEPDSDVASTRAEA